jgi:Ni,Fe-hydrogenase maturation factor
MNTSQIQSHDQSFLIIGYGGMEQGDQGTRYLVTHIIQQLKLQKVKAVAVEMLTPRLAPLLMKAKTVIFISSYCLYENMIPELSIKHFLPHQLVTRSPIVHDNPPQTLLAFTQNIYGRIPEAYWLLIPTFPTRFYNRFSFKSQPPTEELLKRLISESKLDQFLTQLMGQPYAVF